ncbi:MAG: Coenzyme F420 hydrogenase/dehydrogenase, beta subunit C-terminal domain [Dehalococcoidia bacterium]
MTTEVKGGLSLRADVIDRGLCAGCGACVGMCPYLVAYRGRIVALDDCAVEQGRCYAFCPRTATDLDEASEAVFGASFDGGPIGRVAEVLMARAAHEDVREKAQYGGTVSALVAFAIERGFIDSAVLTKSDASLLPAGVLVRAASEVLSHAGSNYVAAPTLAAFNREAQREEARRVGVVATPCQALALAKMRASPLENRNHIEKLSLVVGLFCTWALDYGVFAAFLAEKTPLERISKLDIPPPPANVLRVAAGADELSISLDEVRRFIRPSCNVCLDMTAELADVAVGAAEGIDGWNTVIVRSERGRELVEAARKAGAIETDALPEANLSHLKGASLGKRRRALANIRAMTGSDDDLLYLELRPETRERLLADGPAESK